MAAYADQLLAAQRWDKAVDFGSPMTAWTPEMLRAHAERQRLAPQPQQPEGK